MTAIEPTPAARPSRRWLIAAGVAGVAGLVGARPASATTPPPAPTDPPPSELPELPTDVPLRPTAADIERLQLLQSAEVTARDLYRVAIVAGANDPVFATFAGNHQAYAELLSGLIGGPQPGLDAVLAVRGDEFDSADTDVVARAAYELESELVMTHGAAIGELEGIDGSAMVASILITESRMCAVLADLAGLGDDLTALLDNDAAALTAEEA